MTKPESSAISLDEIGPDSWLLACSAPALDEPVQLVIHMKRRISGNELASIEAALAVVRNLSGHHLISDLAAATEHLKEATLAEFENWKAVSLTVRHSDERTVAMSSWLQEFAKFRRRFENIAASVMEPDRASSVAAQFDSLYRNHPPFRLAWELRNVSQHGDEPLKHASTHSSLVGETDEVLVSWRLNLSPLFASRTNDKGWIACAALWEGQTEVEVLDLIRDAFEIAGWVVASVLVANEDLLRESETLIRAFAEEACPDADGQPLVVQPPQFMSSQVSQMQLRSIGPDTVEQMNHSLEVSHRVLDRA